MQAEEVLTLAEPRSLPEELTDEQMFRQLVYFTIFGLSMALGIIGNLFFYRSSIGINLPIFLLLFVAASAGLVIGFRRTVFHKNAAFMIPALLFAWSFAQVSAPQLTFFNTVMLVGTLFLSVRYSASPRFMGGRWLAPVGALIQFVFIGWLEGALEVLGESRRFSRRIQFEDSQAANIGAALRGIALTVPVVILFGLLLSSADIVFGNFLNGILDLFEPEKPWYFFEEAVLIGTFAWGCMVSFRLLIFGPGENSIERVFQSEAVEEKAKNGFRLSMIESTIMLGSVDTLFLIFVMIQARYLFGGQANINLQGFTYSEYARQGFYELLAVSLMTMVLVSGLDTYTHRKREREYLFRSLSISMIVLTLVILVAAYRRLNLYEDAYGFTRIRVMGGVFMGWLAVLFLFLIRDIIWRTGRSFKLGLVLVSMGFVLTLNAMNMDGAIASRNIQRFEETGKLDVAYLLSLSDDAIPAVADLLINPELEDEDRRLLVDGLGARLYELDRDKQSRNFMAYHFGKAKAWRSLDHYRSSLVGYIHPDRYR